MTACKSFLFVFCIVEKVLHDMIGQTRKQRTESNHGTRAYEEDKSSIVKKSKSCYVLS